ncbi:zf-HC2 domain-containing protein [Streptomyces sp. NBC_01511]|uniref:zf-HC2 domain-containing protein n=1 Tax=Streptomyces sp. NBC_01511 TaxID=2903889 RepID=UPI003864374D
MSGVSRTGGGWHADAALAASYAAGSASEPDAWSLEKHIETCGACAVRVSAAVRRGAAGPVLDDVRAAVLASVRPPAPSPASASAAPSATSAASTAASTAPQVGRTARLLWAAGPALRGAWLLAVVLVAAGAVALAYGADFTGARPVLLALAPVLPLVGVAVSYRGSADPLYEIAASTPGGGLRLLLTRTAAVLAVSLPLLTVAGAVLPASPGAPGAAVWLLPGLALSLAVLALGTYVGCRVAAAGISVVWVLAVTVPVLGPGAAWTASGALAPTAALSEHLTRYLAGPAAQGGWAAGAVLCAGLLALRRRSVEYPAFPAFSNLLNLSHFSAFSNFSNFSAFDRLGRM